MERYGKRRLFRSILVHCNLSQFRICDQKSARKLIELSLSQIDESEWEEELWESFGMETRQEIGMQGLEEIWIGFGVLLEILEIFCNGWVIWEVGMLIHFRGFEWLQKKFKSGYYWTVTEL